MRNPHDDDGDENWKNESIESRPTPGSSRLVTDQPQAGTGYAQQKQPDGPGTWLRLAAMRFPSKSIVSFRLARKLAVIGRWALCRSGDRFHPQYVPEART